MVSRPPSTQLTVSSGPRSSSPPRAVPSARILFLLEVQKSSLGSITASVADNVPKVRATFKYLFQTPLPTLYQPRGILTFPCQVHDSVQVDIATGKIQDTIRFDTGNLCMITGGANAGRVGTIMSRERHQGSFDIVHIKDSQGHVFATRLGYVFVIGKVRGSKAIHSLTAI